MIDELISYLDASVSPFHCVQTTADALIAAGYVETNRASALPNPSIARGFLRDSGSIVAWRMGTGCPEETGFRLVTAHTDSPNLRIKPNPYVRGKGYLRIGLEVYGGVIVPSWVDRDLGISGRVVLRDGAGIRSALVNLDRPLCRIPTLAIHLNRSVNDGLSLNNQTQLPALLAMEDSDDPDPLRRLLAEELSCSTDEILTWDLMLYDLTGAAVSGARGEFLHAARLDNQACCHAGLAGLLGSDDGETTAILALFDHEEIGSTSGRGANSVFLRQILSRLVTTDLDQALARSSMISADMAHAVHPAFAEKHDAEHMPRLNEGVVIKQNVNQRYTTEGDTAAAFLLLCEQAGVPVQWFVNRSDLRCGSTVGPMLASQLAVSSLDIGNPMLSMHSAREMCGTKDHAHMIRAFEAFYSA